MSQEKVERNKEQKANRKATVAKKKLLTRVYSIVAAVICVAFVCWIGYSVYGRVNGSSSSDGYTPVTIEALSDYIQELNE